MHACGWAGSDYSPAAIQLAGAVAERRDMQSVRWLVDDLLHTCILDRLFVLSSRLSVTHQLALSELCCNERMLNYTSARILCI